METPLQITFRGMKPSPAVEERIRSKAAQLEKYHPLIACHAAVQAVSGRRRKGNLYSVHLELGVPGRRDLIVSRDSQDHSHEDINVAIRDAFAAATRQLEDFARRQRLQTKHHDVPLHGRVAKIYWQEGFGFLAAEEGVDIYFHENSVTNVGFTDLEIGDEVRYGLAADGEHGPQASFVTRIGKHHLSD